MQEIKRCVKCGKNILVRFCDRCKNEIWGCAYVFMEVTPNSNDPDYNIELCLKCDEDLKIWLKGEITNE